MNNSKILTMLVVGLTIAAGISFSNVFVPSSSASEDPSPSPSTSADPSPSPSCDGQICIHIDCDGGGKCELTTSPSPSASPSPSPSASPSVSPSPSASPSPSVSPSPIPQGSCCSPTTDIPGPGGSGGSGGPAGEVLGISTLASTGGFEELIKNATMALGLSFVTLSKVLNNAQKKSKKA